MRNTGRPPISCTWAVPRTLVIPARLPVRSFVAKFPSVADDPRLDQLQLLAGTAGRTRSRAAAGRGCRAGGSCSTFVIHTSSRVIPIPSRSSVSSPPARPDEREPLAVLLGAGGLAHEHQVGVGVARAEDDVGPGLRERAELAHGSFAVHLDEALAALLARRAHDGPFRRASARRRAALKSCFVRLWSLAFRASCWRSARPGLHQPRLRRGRRVDAARSLGAAFAALDGLRPDARPNPRTGRRSARTRTRTGAQRDGIRA